MMIAKDVACCILHMPCACFLLQAHEATFLDDAVRELQQDLARVRQEAEDAAGQSALLMATATENAHDREAALHAEVER